MIGRTPQAQPNERRETVTERLERLRLEHRRHIRNVIGPTGTSPSTSSLARVQMPSLPDASSVPVTNNVDTWNTNGIRQAPRPRPNRPNQILPPIIAPQIQPVGRTPVVGPPPPRSWTDRPNAEATPHTNPSRQPIRHTKVVSVSRGRSSRRRRNASSHKEERRKEEEMMEELYGNEYWFRKAGDARWSQWREAALELALTYRGKEGQRKQIFTPFKPVGDLSRVPTLFETNLKLIFQSLVHQGDELENLSTDEIVSLLQMLPSHIQKSILRYAAIHSPFNDEQLRAFYTPPGSEDSNVDPPHDLGVPLTHELLLSGRHADIGLVARIASAIPGTEGDVTRTSDTGMPHTIILFQTPNLSKKHLNSFPKTLTTLALVALPPPPTYKISHRLIPPSSSNSQTTLNTRQCLCPWCDSSIAGTSQTKPSGTRASGQSGHKCSHPAPLVTPTSVLSAIAALPSLLPSLVLLDISYNPWISSEKTIREIKLPRTNNEEPGFGILGRWDLRLWGRLKILGVRGCFDTSISINEDWDFVTKPLLVENWERLLYSIGQNVAVVWKEDQCVTSI